MELAFLNLNVLSRARAGILPEFPSFGLSVIVNGNHPSLILIAREIVLSFFIRFVPCLDRFQESFGILQDFCSENGVQLI